MNNPFEVIEARLCSIENLILNLKHLPKQTISSQDSDQWFDLDDLVTYDPAKRTKSTWYGIVSRNEVPYHKNGKYLIFLKSEIDEWLRKCRKKSKLELEAEADRLLINSKK